MSNEIDHSYLLRDRSLRELETITVTKARKELLAAIEQGRRHLLERQDALGWLRATKINRVGGPFAIRRRLIRAIKTGATVWYMEGDVYADIMLAENGNFYFWDNFHKHVRMVLKREEDEVLEALANALTPAS